MLKARQIANKTYYEKNRAKILANQVRIYNENKQRISERRRLRYRLKKLKRQVAQQTAEVARKKLEQKK
jgi:hypothetical protein